MVTKIKITCDGVFIQSNPFLSTNHNYPSSERSDRNVRYNQAVHKQSLQLETLSASSSHLENSNRTVESHGGSNCRIVRSFSSVSQNEFRLKHDKISQIRKIDQDRNYLQQKEKNLKISTKVNQELEAAAAAEAYSCSTDTSAIFSGGQVIGHRKQQEKTHLDGGSSDRNLSRRLSAPTFSSASASLLFNSKKVLSPVAPSSSSSTSSPVLSPGRLRLHRSQSALVPSPAESAVVHSHNLDVTIRDKTQPKQLSRRKILAASSEDFLRRLTTSYDHFNGHKTYHPHTRHQIIEARLTNGFKSNRTLMKTTSLRQQNSTESVMNSHATTALNLQSSGQTSVVGHHRGFSQPTAANSGDPWFLQSTGHQMPPTAPARQHKRPAPQPGVGGMPIGGGLLQQQQHSQSQPHIVPPMVPPHQNNNQHINSIHLSSHALSSHNLISSNHSPKSPNQQSLHIIPPHPITTNSTCQTQISNSSNNNLMSTSLNTAQLQSHLNATIGLQSSSVVSTQTNTKVQGIVGGGVLHPTSGSHQVVSQHPVTQHQSQLHLQQQQQSSQTSQQQLQSHVQPPPPSIHVPSTNVMSTSLHTFDANGTAWNSTSSLSPTISNTSSTSSNHQHPQRKCEVKLNAMPWFHGSISRDEAEHLLQPREDGLFLVRESTNFPGDYTLCVCFQGKVEHYRVKYLENKLTIDDEEYFENLGQLVAHYEKDADGLCTQLVKCLPKKGKQEFCINSKDFVDKGWVIPEADLQLRESIGKGEFGDVLLGILRNEKVAVKMLKDDGATQKFLAEASVMTTLEHENLVKFIGLVFTNKHIYLVTEYMSKGSLVDYLRSRGRQHITKKDQINFAYDTCSGMEYLEAKKVVHRDLAARNVLISENCVAKVSDFGLAREECYNLEVGKLPIKWTAPEALKGGRFSNKSDMWSFGILLWEIYSFGRVPYPRIPLADVVKHVEVGYKMEAPEGCPPEIYEMMRQAWDLNPSKRPTFQELKVKLLQLKNATT